MKLQQIVLDNQKKANVVYSSVDFSSDKVSLVLAFGERSLLEHLQPYDAIHTLYPNAEIVICSTSGQISNTSLVENNVVK